jgi:predicted glycoside hydrolase/deacetylase ChbG (UPF0249 family)
MIREREDDDMARRVIVHLDDVGMCHGSNAAYLELARSGAITCGSVMVPCPWFLEVARACAADPTLDMGVHLVLTSEFQHYRWRPLSGVSRASGLIDDDGYFHARVPAVRRNAHPEAVEAELRLQIDTAMAAGIEPTHLDAHMFGAVAPEFVGIYERLGRDYRLPVLMGRDFARWDVRTNLGPFDESAYAEVRAALASRGNPIVDAVFETIWTTPAGASARCDYEAILRRIPDGLTFLALHMNAPGEIEAIDPGRSHIRTDELQLFRDPSFLGQFDALGLERVGMREFRDAMRARA